LCNFYFFNRHLLPQLVAQRCENWYASLKFAQQQVPVLRFNFFWNAWKLQHIYCQETWDKKYFFKQMHFHCWCAFTQRSGIFHCCFNCWNSLLHQSPHLHPLVFVIFIIFFCFKLLPLHQFWPQVGENWVPRPEFYEEHESTLGFYFILWKLFSATLFSQINNTTWNVLFIVLKLSNEKFCAICYFVI
jgi:hypothetical protein